MTELDAMRATFEKLGGVSTKAKDLLFANRSGVTKASSR